MADNTSNSLFSVSEVTIKGFKSIEDLKVPVMSGLNILIGKNGAGKSNFLEGIDALMSSIYQSNMTNIKAGSILFSTFDNEDAKYELERLNTKNSGNPGDIGFLNGSYQQKLILKGEVIFDNTSYENREIEFRGQLFKAGDRLWSLIRRLGIYTFAPVYIPFEYPIDMEGISVPTVLNIPLNQDEPWGVHNINSTLLLIAFSKLGESLNNQEEPEGENNWTDVLEDLTPDRLIAQLELNQNVIDNLRLFTPIQDIRFNRNISIYKNDTHLIADNIRLDFLVNDNWLPWSQLSDGTKRLFCIVTEVTLNKNGLTLLEEPELGVHPHQFYLIMQFLKEQSEDQQIIISTHSPKALDILEPDELNRIMIARYEKGKGTKILRMTEEQKEKAVAYMGEVGYLSDYWLMSDLEE